MLNKFLLLALIPILFFVVSDAVNCSDSTTGGFCQGAYCYYVNYTSFDLNGGSTSEPFYGCTPNGTLQIPKGSNKPWTFPVNHCQHFQTNTTGLGYAYIYGNVCDTRDDCIHTTDGTSLVCAGLRTSPFMGLSLVVIVGILLAKFIV